MKQLLILTKLSFILVVALHLGACASTSSTTAASPQKEQLLTQAGFVVKTATTDKQKEKLAALPGNQVSAVKYNGKLFYAYPAGSGNQVYVGRQKQFDTYKQLLKAQLAQAQPSSVPTTQPTIVEEGAGPNHIVVNQFDGFGPLGTDTGDF
ncbi:MAG: hypothetical protein DMF04_07910 [Verrucomicrobia bacterium]|jgi:hypothetical protein|nr:MAG: hypothetical protein DMF04_07910 [Verrucomicrobiota bacterium]